MKILFKIYPQKSHFNATFPLARRLRELGHEVVYAGLQELEAHATAQGFAYHVQATDLFRYVENQPNSPKLTFWLAFWMWWKNRNWAASIRAKFSAADPFGPLLRATQPDAVLVDSPYTIYALSLRRHGIPFGTVESMMNLSQAPGCTPLDTTHVPRPGWWSAFVVRWHWARYYVKRWLFGKLGFRIDFNRRFVRERAAAAGVPMASLDFSRYFHPAFTAVPEFILSPQALDLPRQPRPNQVYVGPSVLMDRAETASDYRFETVFTRFATERKQGRRLVYCSLGTAGWRYAGAEEFLRRVVAAAQGGDWNLILAIGTNFDPAKFPVSRHVAVFQVVPQLKVLREADLMLTHGGMNSITECVLTGVPMIVYPGTAQIDQAGNAARVSYHRLGLQGRLKLESAARIRQKIAAILADDAYAERVRSMAGRIRSSDAWIRGAELMLERLRSVPQVAAGERKPGQARNKIPSGHRGLATVGVRP